MADPTSSVLLTVAYDGSRYSGFVRQQNGPSIAAELDRAIQLIDPAATPVVGASRTDAGVHARGQAASFATQRSIQARGWVLALNQSLSPDVAILRAAPQPLGYDCRRHALWKKYRYLIHLSPVADPFLAGRAWRLGYGLDVELMQRAARTLVGTHDFAAFRSAADTRERTVRTLQALSVQPALVAPLGAPPGACLEILVRGDRFMHNMVRIVVGTLVDIGRGHLPPDTFERALSTKRRIDLGMTAPASGLCLDHVELTDFGAGWPG